MFLRLYAHEFLCLYVRMFVFLFLCTFHFLCVRKSTGLMPLQKYSYLTALNLQFSTAMLHLKTSAYVARHIPSQRLDTRTRTINQEKGPKKFEEPSLRMLQKHLMNACVLCVEKSVCLVSRSFFMCNMCDKFLYVLCEKCAYVFMCLSVRVFVRSCVRLFLCSCVRMFVCSCVRVFVCSYVRLFSLPCGKSAN